jgi:hypothetical protein
LCAECAQEYIFLVGAIVKRVLQYVSYALNPIAIGVSIYLYFLAVQDRKPMFFVNPQRARIVDTSVPAPPQLQVLYKGKDLKTDLSAVSVYIWNEGKLAIKSEDVLEPITVQLEPGCAILEARLLKVSRGVTGFARGDVSDAAKNVLPLSFKCLKGMGHLLFWN